MSTAAIYLVVAFGAGLIALLLRLPPLVGFLVAGFALHAADVDELPALDTFADLGVTLLLFGIGLKLDVRSLLKPEVWLATVVHAIFSVAVGLALLAVLVPLGFGLLTDADLSTLLLIGLALSFSSTVFVIKVLDERRDHATLYGRLAIGVLVMQDIVAVVFLTISQGHVPSPWAFALVLLIPAAWVFRRVWGRLGHAEMRALYGVGLALVPGYWLFDAVGLKGDLGALVMGALLAGHPAAADLSKLLFTVKELLLVGFFVSIGLTGAPSLESIGLAALLLVLLPLQAAAYSGLFILLKLRYRTSVLAGLSLTNYSEFALIVAAVGVTNGWLDPEWLVVLAVAVALSFLVSAVVNRSADAVVVWVSRRLPVQGVERLQAEDRPLEVGHAQAIVLGMGRVGRATFEQLRNGHGLTVIGVEHDTHVVEQLRARGLDVVEADATDVDFWHRVNDAGEVQLAVLAMPFHGENLLALSRLRESGFAGKVAAIAQRDDELTELREKYGVDAVFNLYGSAGVALADQAIGAVGVVRAARATEPA